MICPVHQIDGGERGCPLCARKVKKPKFGEVRKPLKKSTERATRMSADADVQPEIAQAGRCLLIGFLPGDCGVKVQRAHIVSQELIRDTYPKGAWRMVGEEYWRPITRHTVFPSHTAYEQVSLQQILDDNSNLVRSCEVHNVDGLAMIDALDARKVAGVPSYPAGFGEFTHSFRFDIRGQAYWYYVPLEAAA